MGVRLAPDLRGATTKRAEADSQGHGKILVENQPTEETIQVLVVDDPAFARAVITRSLTSDPCIEVVGYPPDGETALELIPVLQPDVVTTEVGMPGIGGPATLRRVMAEIPTPGPDGERPRPLRARRPPWRPWKRGRAIFLKASASNPVAGHSTSAELQ